MASTHEPGHARSIPPELAFLVLFAAFAVGLALAWPWNWK
jgi:hypothetical protein